MLKYWRAKLGWTASTYTGLMHILLIISLIESEKTALANCVVCFFFVIVMSDYKSLFHRCM